MTDPARSEPAQPEDWQQRWDELNREPRLARWHPATLRAAWWALRSRRTATKQLKRDGIGHRSAPPPTLPWGARTGVEGVLKRTDPTCLERSVVWQAWLSAHGIAREVVVGVRSDAASVQAHAWVDGMTDPAEYAGYHEIHRIRPA